jgi:hypothetical protein
MNEDFQMYIRQVNKALELSRMVGRLMGLIDYLVENDKLKDGCINSVKSIQADIQNDLKTLFPD